MESVTDEERRGSVHQRSMMIARLERELKARFLALYQLLRNRYLPRMIILGAVVGLLGGLAAAGFAYLILGVKYVFFGASSIAVFLDSVRAQPWPYRLVAPALGGLLVGPIVTYVAREVYGQGVPNVIQAIGLRGGAIRFRVAPLTALASAICIGSGGSAGRLGPIVEIGSTLGSSVARYFELPTEQVKILLTAGAAAGIGGTFNAPLAGIIFGLEVLLKRIDLWGLASIGVAAVVGTAVGNVALGRTAPVFDIHPYQILNYRELVFYVGLGIAGAGVALVYSNALYGMEYLFKAVFAQRALRAAFGGLLLGAVALAYPQIQATGYPTVGQALQGRLPLQLMLALMAAKILATSLTLGSGGSGGVFGPAVFVGAMMGGAYGGIVNALFPGATGPAYSYAIVGLASVFAGAAHAPLASSVILYELTGDGNVLVPAMCACIVASVLAARLQEGSIFTRKLIKRGVDIEGLQQQRLVSIELEVEAGSDFDGEEVGDLDLPPACLLTHCTNGRDECILHRRTSLEADMTITAVIPVDDFQGLAALQRRCKARQGKKGRDRCCER